MAQYKSGVRTKRSIYYASEKLFYEKGFEETRISDINELTGTNKSSFYHFYSNKLDIGVQIYYSFARGNARIASLFGNSIDQITAMCLEIKTFWYLFFKDEKIRRFATDLANENVWKVKEYTFIYDLCQKLSKVEIPANEMIFIRIANTGLSKQLALDAYTNTDQYNYDDVSDYYLKTLFKLFNIDMDTINKILTETKELFSKCEVTNEGFYVNCRLK